MPHESNVDGCTLSSPSDVTRWVYIKDILPCDYGQLHASYINASTDIQQLMCNNTPFSIHSVTYLLCRLRPIRYINMSFTT